MAVDVLPPEPVENPSLVAVLAETDRLHRSEPVAGVLQRVDDLGIRRFDKRATARAQHVALVGNRLRFRTQLRSQRTQILFERASDPSHHAVGQTVEDGERNHERDQFRCGNLTDPVREAFGHMAVHPALDRVKAVGHRPRIGDATSELGDDSGVLALSDDLVEHLFDRTVGQRIDG